jgi:glycosyltransferase involved in cell wall biosynthesis
VIIGLVSEYFPPFAPGGAEWSTQALARALVEAGHTVTVITPNYGQQAAASTNESGVRIARFAFPVKLAPGQKSIARRIHANPAFYLYSAVQIAQIARTHQLDVLHAQGTYSLPGALWASWWVGARAFFTLRDTSTICPITVCFLNQNFVPYDCGRARYHSECLPAFQKRYLRPTSGPRALWRRLSFDAQWWDARLRRDCLARVDGVIAVSQGILGVYIRAGLVGPERARVVYNIPPTEHPAAEQVAVWRERLALGRQPVVLYVGKFSPGKGTQDLVEASAAVVKRVPQAVFLFAGKGELRASAAHTINLGSLPHDDVLALYALADVVVVPSVWPEPLSRVILEAMAAGRPVVATRTGGSPEAVVDGVTGLLVPRSHPKALADAVVGLLTDDERRKAMGQAALKRAHEFFSAARNLENLIEFYRRSPSEPEGSKAHFRANQ